MDTKSYITDLDTYLVALEVRHLLKSGETPFEIRGSVVGSALQAFAGDTDLMRIIVEVVENDWSDDYWKEQMYFWGAQDDDFTREAGSRLADDYPDHSGSKLYKRGILTPGELFLRILSSPYDGDYSAVLNSLVELHDLQWNQ